MPSRHQRTAREARASRFMTEGPKQQITLHQPRRALTVFAGDVGLAPPVTLATIWTRCWTWWAHKMREK